MIDVYVFHAQIQTTLGHFGIESSTIRETYIAIAVLTYLEILANQ